MQDLKPILLVEDDNVDAMTVRRSLRDLSTTNILIHSVNGEEALDYLSNEKNTKPSLILLDLNMPKMNGIEFLKIIKADDRLKKIPVVVLTTSQEKRDVVQSFDLGAAGYMVKPVDYTRFVETIDTILLYWRANELPKQDSPTADAEVQAAATR